MNRNPKAVFELGYDLGSAERFLQQALRARSRSGHYETFAQLLRGMEHVLNVKDALSKLDLPQELKTINQVVEKLKALLNQPIVGASKAWTPRHPDPDREIEGMRRQIHDVFWFVSYQMKETPTSPSRSI